MKSTFCITVGKYEKNNLTGVVEQCVENQFKGDIEYVLEIQKKMVKKRKKIKVVYERPLIKKLRQFKHPIGQRNAESIM